MSATAALLSSAVGCDGAPTPGPAPQVRTDGIPPSPALQTPSPDLQVRSGNLPPSVTWTMVGAPRQAAKIAACSEGDGRLYALNDDRSLWVSHANGSDGSWQYLQTPAEAQQIFCADDTLFAFNDDRTLWRNDGTDADIRWTYVGRPASAQQVTGTTAIALFVPYGVLYALNDDNTLWKSSTGADGSWTYVGKPFAARRIAAGGSALEARPFALNGDGSLWLNDGDGCDAYWSWIDQPSQAAEITAASAFTLYALNGDRTLWKGTVNNSSGLTSLLPDGHPQHCDGQRLVPNPNYSTANAAACSSISDPPCIYSVDFDGSPGHAGVHWEGAFLAIGPGKLKWAKFMGYNMRYGREEDDHANWQQFNYGSDVHDVLISNLQPNVLYGVVVEGQMGTYQWSPWSQEIQFIVNR